MNRMNIVPALMGRQILKSTNHGINNGVKVISKRLSVGMT